MGGNRRSLNCSKLAYHFFPLHYTLPCSTCIHGQVHADKTCIAVTCTAENATCCIRINSGHIAEVSVTRSILSRNLLDAKDRSDSGEASPGEGDNPIHQFITIFSDSLGINSPLSNHKYFALHPSTPSNTLNLPNLSLQSCSMLQSCLGAQRNRFRQLFRLIQL